MDYKYIQNNNITSLLLHVIFVYIKLTDFTRFDVVCQETVHCPEAGKGEGEGGDHLTTWQTCFYKPCSGD